MTLVGVHLHGPDRTDINDLLTERYRVYLMLADERAQIVADRKSTRLNSSH